MSLPLHSERTVSYLKYSSKVAGLKKFFEEIGLSGVSRGMVPTKMVELKGIELSGIQGEVVQLLEPAKRCVIEVTHPNGEGWLPKFMIRGADNKYYGPVCEMHADFVLCRIEQMRKSVMADVE
jgi:hypothetical protein